MEDVQYNVVIPTLFRLLPEAKQAYDAWDMPGDPLPYIVFSFVEESLFTPALDKSVDSDLSRRLFDFLEQMALSRDSEVVYLLSNLLETWASRPALFGKALDHMGPGTKTLASQAF